MPRIQTRWIVLLLSNLLLLALVAALSSRIAAWHRVGWMGLRFHGDYEQKLGVKLPDLGPMTPQVGKVTSVAMMSPAEAAGIREGDTVLTVNGIPVRERERLRELAGRVRLGSEVTYRIRQGGHEREIRLRSVSPIQLPRFVISVSADFLVAAIFIAFSVFVYWNRPRSRASWVFYWLCTVAALFFGASSVAELDINMHDGVEPIHFNAPALTMFVLYSFLSVVVTALMLHLALVFPRERPIIREHPMVTRWVHTLLLLPFFLMAMLIPATIIAKKSGWAQWPLVALAAALAIWLLTSARRRSASWWPAILDHPWRVEGASVAGVIAIVAATIPFVAEEHAFTAGLILGLFIGSASTVGAIAFAVFTVVALYRGYKASDVEEKRQVRWPLWGLIVAVAMMALAGIVVMILAYAAGEVETASLFGAMVTRVAFALVPVTFAFGILKYRLMSIDVIIRKTVIYSIVTSVIVGAFFVLVAGLGSLITTHFRVRSQAVTVVATLLLAAVFIPIRNRVQRFIDRRFFRRKYDAAEAEKLVQQEILQATALPPLLRKVAEYVQQALRCRAVAILCPMVDDDRLVTAGAIGVQDEVARRLTLDPDALPNMSGAFPVSSLRLSQDEWGWMKRVGGELAVPMSLRGQLRGVMIVGPMLSGKYDEDDKQFLASIGQQIALGIDNLTVSDEMRDFERAAEIQRALLPKTMPRVEGVDVGAAWNPARLVGGDYFDVFTLGSSSCLGLCIADVAGKGMPAALLMASLQAAVKASIRAEMQPSEVADRVRDVVCGTLSGGRFVTFFLGMLDTSSMVLRYTNAGHNPPLLVKRGGGVQRLDRGGPVFARLMQGTSYQTAEVALEEGDLLVLFTDGVTESRNAAEEEFGEQRLVDLVRRSPDEARLVVRDIVDGVQSFSSGVAHDDVTVVCARMTRGAAENVVAFTRMG